MNKAKEWKLGNKVREIDTDRHQHKISFLIGLILINLLLIVACVYFLIKVKIWWLISIAVLLSVGMLIYSYFTLKKHDMCHTYTLYDNCVIIHSLFSERYVHLEDVFLIEIEQTNRDKVYDTKSLILYEKSHSFYKSRMPYIKEDTLKLREEIMAYANESRTNREQLIEEENVRKKQKKASR